MAGRRVPGLFVPWTIRTLDYSYHRWTIRTMDYLYNYWTIRTMLQDWQKLTPVRWTFPIKTCLCNMYKLCRLVVISPSAVYLFVLLYSIFTTQILYAVPAYWTTAWAYLTFLALKLSRFLTKICCCILDCILPTNKRTCALCSAAFNLYFAKRLGRPTQCLRSPAVHREIRPLLSKN